MVNRDRTRRRAPLAAAALAAFLIAGGLAGGLAGCGSAEPRADESVVASRGGVREKASEAPPDPEAERAESARVKAERRRVVEGTLEWIVAEAAARAAGAAPAPEPER